MSSQPAPQSADSRSAPSLPPASRQPSLRARRPVFDFADVPRHWAGGNAVATQIANAVNLLFPAGERFFVRSVYRFVDDLDDDRLREDVRGFARQEGSHAAAHEAFFDAMRSQGYTIDPLLKAYQRLAFGWLERRLSPSLRLAATAAAEHYTAIMAEGALAYGLFQHADPRMRSLLLWHAAEEIEHKAVAFDVLRQVDPRYSVRIAGLALSTIMLAGGWAVGTVVLLRQDRLGWRELLRQARESARNDPRRKAGGRGTLRDVFLRGIRDYLRRDFHPNDNDNYELAQDYLEGAGLLGAA